MCVQYDTLAIAYITSYKILQWVYNVRSAIPEIIILIVSGSCTTTKRGYCK